ncbi:hypothetical protein E2562_022033 [Oryza meyeriana var. granulata]|uniref:Uncharacterized protein n=1 Tax=Oryza meyeriana var. granulata TaxID=110450 RepID=A0A6G1ENK5_9ORYZ|nr:hypothetical protein E2562_022033 [Oryza meyeriana var. granulata]
MPQGSPSATALLPISRPRDLPHARVLLYPACLDDDDGGFDGGALVKPFGPIHNRALPQATPPREGGRSLQLLVEANIATTAFWRRVTAAAREAEIENIN